MNNSPHPVNDTFIRPATPHDSDAIIAVAVASGIFPAEETEMLETVLSDHFAGNGGGHVCVLEEEGVPVAVAYYTPAVAADRTWDLTMIAVRPERQRQGYGATLLGYMETALRGSGQRLLLVDTSGLPEYESARAFYAKQGFEREARIRDFYADGDDKIVFRKSLRVS
ncbi:MAG: GNAT family N-acetyltransferase [Akkermansiaceae bacterium]|nr:GNAT family N-acetyltransferase [Armatimonadota bacterium]